MWRSIAAWVLSWTILPACAPSSGTPGRAGPLEITDFHTPDGTATIQAAECLGFTVRAREDGVRFSADTTVTLGSLPVPVSVVDEKTLRAGVEETGFDCFFLPVFLASHGELALTVVSGDRAWHVTGALMLQPPAAFEIGTVAKERVWSRDVVSDAGANVFERRWDVDVYRVTFTDAYHVYDDVDFFPLGDPGLVPEMQLWSERYPDSYLGRGGLGLVFPQSGEQLVVVRDAFGRGGETATYDLAFVGEELGSREPSDACEGAPLIGTRAIHAGYDDLQDDFDPDGSCVDSVYGTPIRGGGADGVWRVKVPAGGQLRVSSYDDHVNAVLWIMDPADGCREKPVCLAAAGRFGGGNTDTLVWTNEDLAERELLLVHDAEREPELEDGEDEVGSFLLDVEIFD